MKIFFDIFWLGKHQLLFGSVSGLKITRQTEREGERIRRTDVKDRAGFFSKTFLTRAIKPEKGQGEIRVAKSRRTGKYLQMSNEPSKTQYPDLSSPETLLQQKWTLKEGRAKKCGIRSMF